MSRDSNPTCPLLQQFAQDLKIAGLRERTQESYCRVLRKFTDACKKRPDQATEDDVRKYYIEIVDQRRLSTSSINVIHQGMKKFYSITYPRDWKVLKLARIQTEQKLPVVLSVGEVHTLLKLIDKPAMRCFFSTVYNLGLRLQEGLFLQPKDIDSKRMLVHIHRGKGAKDRLIPLPESTLELLRDYWSTHRNPNWIFPAEGRNHKQSTVAEKPMSESSVQDVIKAVLKQLNWGNRGISTHTLRHCYATHLLEAVVSLKLIQKYLGHRHLTSTMVYLHVTTVGEEAAIRKINAIMKRSVVS